MNQPKKIYDSDASFQRAVEMSKRHSKTHDFRTIGDELSGHEGAMIVAGIKAAEEPKTQAPGAPKPAR